MNKQTLSVMIAFCFLLTVQACSVITRERRLPHPDQLAYPVLKPNPPVPERIDLDNGLTIYLLEDHELPLIQMTALIRTGSMYDPPDRAGLASLTGTVMRTGGTAHLSPEAVDTLLDEMSADISVSINTEEAFASLSVLTEDFDKGLDIFSQILMEPAFNSAKLMLAKDNYCQSLRRLPDNPQQLAFREFKRLLYRGNPRGNLPTIPSIQHITKSDLKNFHRIFFHPERIYLGVSGDFHRETMLKKIKSKFLSWPSSSPTFVSIAVPQAPNQPSIYLLQKKVPQSTIIFGHLAPSKNETDYFAFQVLDYILGSGGLSSHLMAEVRTKRGLAYSVGSFYRGAVDYGVFGVYGMTKTEKTFHTLAVMLDIINTLKNGGITAEELSQAKESLINSFIFSYTSSEHIVLQEMMREYEHLPPDFIRTTPDKIRSVTFDDLIRVAQRNLHPAAMALLIIGDDSGFDRLPEQLHLGPVQYLRSNILTGK